MRRFGEPGHHPVLGRRSSRFGRASGHTVKLKRRSVAGDRRHTESGHRRRDPARYRAAGSTPRRSAGSTSPRPRDRPGPDGRRLPYRRVERRAATVPIRSGSGPGVVTIHGRPASPERSVLGLGDKHRGRRAPRNRSGAGAVGTGGRCSNEAARFVAAGVSAAAGACRSILGRSLRRRARSRARPFASASDLRGRRNAPAATVHSSGATWRPAVVRPRATAAVARGRRPYRRRARIGRRPRRASRPRPIRAAMIRA